MLASSQLLIPASSTRATTHQPVTFSADALKVETPSNRTARSKTIARKRALQHEAGGGRVPVSSSTTTHLLRESRRATAAAWLATAGVCVPVHAVWIGNRARGEMPGPKYCEGKQERVRVRRVAASGRIIPVLVACLHLSLFPSLVLRRCFAPHQRRRDSGVKIVADVSR